MATRQRWQSRLTLHFIYNSAGAASGIISSCVDCSPFGSLKLTLDLGLVKGLNEVCKALDRKEAVLCVLAENCDDPKYKKLITALAKANSIPVITIENRNDIGEWLGHCKYDKEGKARKVKGTSSVAIKDFGEETAALQFVLNHIKEKNL